MRSLLKSTSPHAKCTPPPRHGRSIPRPPLQPFNPSMVPPPSPPPPRRSSRPPIPAPAHGRLLIHLGRRNLLVRDSLLERQLLESLIIALVALVDEAVSFIDIDPGRLPAEIMPHELVRRQCSESSLLLGCLWRRRTKPRCGKHRHCVLVPRARATTPPQRCHQNCHLHQQNGKNLFHFHKQIFPLYLHHKRRFAPRQSHPIGCSTESQVE